MQRLPDLSADELTSEQQQLSSQVASTRNGAVAGPFAIWLRVPGIALTANEFDNQLRLHGTVDKRLFELAVLVVARSWTAQYEWYAHEASARAAGLQQSTIDGIRDGTVPSFAKEDEGIVYRVAYEITERKTLSEETYRSAEALLGTNKLIEIITVVGFYVLVAVVVTSFECAVPSGVLPLPVLPSPTER